MNSIGFNLERCEELLKGFKGADISNLGDGLCNRGPYNTRVCGYDGGDCCEKTCEKQVRSEAQWLWVI